MNTILVLAIVSVILLIANLSLLFKLNKMIEKYEDCQPTDWGEWSPCSKSCGGGTQFRTKDSKVQLMGGVVCPTLKETRECNTQPCPSLVKSSLVGCC